MLGYPDPVLLIVNKAAEAQDSEVDMVVEGVYPSDNSAGVK